MGFWEGKRALVTGGLGFTGSNLVHALVAGGAKVTIVDNMVPDLGGNIFNVAGIRDRLVIHTNCITNAERMNEYVQEQDFVFHLAGQVDHILSQTNPFIDINFNVTGTAVVLEAIRKFNPEARFLYTGTRGQYGSVTELPVLETAPTNPKGVYELTNLTAEKLAKIYHDNYGIRSVMLRISNLYGERAQMKHPRYGVVNWFVRQVIEGEKIKIFGDGKILRDFLYVGDCVDAILRCAETDDAYGEVFNVGGDRPYSFSDLADTIVNAGGEGRWELAEFSIERKIQEPGDFYPSLEKIGRVTGWAPRTDLLTGLQRTFAFYREHKKHYW
jgi:UDP-glucose 4-epimerase